MRPSNRPTYPRDYKYTTDHQWVDLCGQGCTIGITAHAQQHLGEIVHIVLPREGARLTQGQLYGTIETCDAILELRVPVSGEVVAVNTALNEGPATVNADPLRSWIIALKLQVGAGGHMLLDVTEYARLVGHVEEVESAG